jgi:opacity protein-like surface antigen
MPRPFLRARATLLTALIGMFMAPAQAADLFSLPEAPALPEEPVEWGSNWYLRGDIGWQQIKVPALSGDFKSSLNNADLAMGAIGGGYQFYNWLRADVTVDRSVFRKSGTIGQLWCPYQMVGLSDQVTGHTVGILANPNDTCSRIATASLVRTSVMANAYFDIYHFWGLTPYVGAGVGMTYNSAASSIGYFRNSDGALWAPDLTLPNGQVPRWVYRDGGTLFPIQLPFGPTNWNISQSKSGWQFAWNVMAGVSYDLAQNLKVDLGYRYLNAGRYTGIAGYGTTAIPVSKDITAQEVRLGVRVTTN